MKKIGIISLLLIFTLNIFPYNSQAINKFAEDKVKNELHSQLEEKLGTDIPVETVLQTLDHLAHGEFDKAKNVASEELAKQFVGILVGSEAGGIIGLAWDFAKYSFTSVQEWGKKVEMQRFVNDFLKPQVEMWERSGKVPKFSFVIEQMNRWIDENSMSLGVIQLPTERKRYMENFRSEAWRKTLEVHTKYRRYFFLKKQAEDAARRALNEYLRHVQLAKIHYQNVAKLLELAKLEVNKDNIERYDSDSNFRILVERVADINLSLSEKNRISLDQYLSLLKKLAGFNREQIKEAYIALSKSKIFVADVQNVRLYLLNPTFRQKVQEDLKKESNPPRVHVSESEVKKVSDNIYNLSKDEFYELTTNTPLTFEDKLKQVVKGIKFPPEGEPDFSPVLSLYDELIDSYLNGEITFNRFLNLRLRLFLSVSDLYSSAERNFKVRPQERKIWADFIKEFRQKDGRFASARRQAMEKLQGIKKEICQKDDLLKRIGEAKRKIKSQTGGKIDSNFIDSMEQMFNNAAVTGYRFTLPSSITLNYLKQRITEFKNHASNIKQKVDLLQKETRDLNEYAEYFYKTLSKMAEEYKIQYSKMAYLLEGYPAKWDVLTDITATYHQEPFFEEPCDLDIEDHYTKGISEISDMESELFKLSNIYQNMLDYIDYLEKQEKLNEEISGTLTVNLASIINKAYQRDVKKVYEIGDKLAGFQSQLEGLLYSFKQNRERLNSDFVTEDEVFKEVESKRTPETYVPLSVYRSRFSKLKAKVSDCNSLLKPAEDDYNEVKKYITVVNSIAKQIEAWDEGILNRYEKFSGDSQYLQNLKIDKRICDTWKQSIAECESTLNKLKNIEQSIYARMEKGIKNNKDDFIEALNEAKVLPFKPSFDLAVYEREAEDYFNKNYSVYCEFPQIEEVYVNGEKVEKYIYLIPSKVKGSRIEISGKYKVFGKDKSCYPKRISIAYEKGTVECKLLSGNRFVCYIDKPFNPTVYTLVFEVESNRDIKKRPVFITINYGTNLGEIQKYLNTFLNYYNSGKNLQVFFLRGSSTTEIMLKIANENRKKFKHNLIFENVSVIGMKSYGRDGLNRLWTAKVEVRWKAKGDVEKNGTAYLYITKYKNRLLINTSRYLSSYTIDNIEGDTFFTYFARESGKVKKTSGIAIIAHGGVKGGGYSFDFETATYSNSEKDIAAGYVNPNAKAEGYDRPYFGWGMIIDMGKTPFESVKCPKTGYDPYKTVLAIVGHTYCVKTQEGNYVKIQVLETGGTGFNAYIKFKWQFCNK